MHYNQPYCNNPPNALNNGNGCSYNIYTPPQINNGFYPHSIVGEGDVNCVTLPDGTCQFYFTPTANWWYCNTYPYNVNNLNNINPCWNPNVGTWFVRSITSPIPAVWNNSSYPRNEAPMPLQSLDCNRNGNNNGYQLKFHNDVWTSTTDIHYFYPCLRQIDCTLAFPSKGCAAVQVDTAIATNTICHCEVVCSKPGDASPIRVNTSVSAMSVASNKPTEAVTCRCAPLEFKRSSTNKSLQRLQLLPSDGSKKRIKLERKKQKIESKRKDAICYCSPPPSVNKSVHNVCKTDINRTKNVQFSRCWKKETPAGQRYAYGTEPEIWRPAPESLKNILECRCSPTLSSERITQNKSRNGGRREGYNSPSLSTEKLMHSTVISESRDVICQNSPTNSSKLTPQSANKKRSNDIISHRHSLQSSEKVPTTEDTCKANGCDCRGRKIAMFQRDALLKTEPEMWCPLTDSLEKIFDSSKSV